MSAAAVNVGQLISAVLGLATGSVSLWAASYNWLGLIRGLRGTRRASPILLIGPLFAFIAGGLLSRAFPEAPSLLAWLPGIAFLVLDPGALPLVAWALLRRAGGKRSS